MELQAACKRIKRALGHAFLCFNIAAWVYRPHVQGGIEVGFIDFQTANKKRPVNKKSVLLPTRFA